MTATMQLRRALDLRDQHAVLPGDMHRHRGLQRHMRACGIGKCAQWIQVTATDGTAYQKVAAAAPDKCQ